MQRIRVDVDKLKGILETNVAQHRETFETALEGWRRQCIEEMERNLSDAKAGRSVRRYVQLERPEDHTLDYQQAIRMCEMSVESEVELTHQEFRELVLDEWSWSDNFTRTANSYLQQKG